MRGSLWTASLLALTGCFDYGCGDFEFTVSSGSYQLGEWCGADFGSFALQNADGVQIVIDPASGDDEATSAAINHTIAINIDIATEAFGADRTFTLSDAQFACVHSQAGAGSGDIRFDTPAAATLEVGALVREDDDKAIYRMSWEVDCSPIMTASGADKVPLTAGLSF